MADKMSFQQKLADIMKLAQENGIAHDSGGDRTVF